MGYKLNGYKLDFIAENIVTYRKRDAKRRLYVDMGDKSTGETAYGYLAQVYPVKSYDKGWDWADFTLIFESEKDRNDAYNDMNAAISAWKEAEAALNDDSPLRPPTPQQPSTTDEEEDEDDEKEKATDLTTYIIIGVAAVAVIILLLWNPRRK